MKKRECRESPEIGGNISFYPNETKLNAFFAKGQERERKEKRSSAKNPRKEVSLGSKTGRRRVRPFYIGDCLLGLAGLLIGGLGIIAAGWFGGGACNPHFAGGNPLGITKGRVFGAGFVGGKFILEVSGHKGSPVSSWGSESLSVS